MISNGVCDERPKSGKLTGGCGVVVEVVVVVVELVVEEEPPPSVKRSQKRLDPVNVLDFGLWPDIVLSEEQL